MRKGVEVSNWIVGGNQGGIDPARSGVLFSNVTARWCEAIENKKSKFVKRFLFSRLRGELPQTFSGPSKVQYLSKLSYLTETTCPYLTYFVR